MGTQTLPISNSEVREIGGRLFFIFVADNQGEVVELLIPAEGIEAVFNDLQTKIDAHRNFKNGATGQAWVKSFHREGTPAQIAPTSDGKIVLIARSGLPDETRLCFSPEDALALSEALREEVRAARTDVGNRAH